MLANVAIPVTMAAMHAYSFRVMDVAYIAGGSIQAGSVYALVCLNTAVLAFPAHHTSTVIVI